MFNIPLWFNIKHCCFCGLKWVSLVLWNKQTPRVHYVFWHISWRALYDSITHRFIKYTQRRIFINLDAKLLEIHLYLRWNNCHESLSRRIYNIQYRGHFCCRRPSSCSSSLFKSTDKTFQNMLTSEALRGPGARDFPRLLLPPYFCRKIEEK